MNTVGEPCARKPHARFDEGRPVRSNTNPVAYSTTRPEVSQLLSIRGE
jgi:hypothetical protein